VLVFLLGSNSAGMNKDLRESSKFPKWLNVSFGYSAEGMLGAKVNPKYIEGNPLPYYQRYRQYFFSLDIDMARIKTKSHFARFLLNGLNFIKIPFPTLEYNEKDGVVFHFLYF